MSKKIIQFEITGWHSEDYLDESELSDSDSDSDDNKKYKINKDKSLYKIIVWGKDINEKTYTLEINEFTPYFYIKLPNNARSHHKDAIENFVRRNMWKKYQDCFLRTTISKPIILVLAFFIFFNSSSLNCFTFDHLVLRK